MSRPEPVVVQVRRVVGDNPFTIRQTFTVTRVREGFAAREVSGSSLFERVGSGATAAEAIAKAMSGGWTTHAADEPAIAAAGARAERKLRKAGL